MEDNFRGEIRTSYRESIPWWPDEKKAPENAPNILYILLDDTGYAQVGCYGSRVSTPNIDSLAEEGLRFSDFHVNAMCSPTRASLLSGCNNHTAGFAHVCNFNLGYPNMAGEIDPKYGLISETLKENGYFTCALGKWHLCNTSHMTGAGPFDQWPCGRGFDKFYGFLRFGTSQCAPTLVQGNEPIDPPYSYEDGYQLGGDLVDRAIRYIGDQKSSAPDKPFFCYLAFGAMHGPHQAPREYIDRYKGKFDDGWDKYREEVFARQKAMGLIPENTKLTERNSMAPEWDSLSDRQKKVFARYMEVFAGYLTYTDDQIGRLLDYLKDIGQYDDTLVVFLTDNGASAEGGPNGCFNEYYHILSMNWEGLVDDERLEQLGSAEACANYPPGWAWAGNTPLKWYKSWVHAGGVKVPCIMRYPKRIKDKGGIRNQFHHVIDIYSTVMDICGLEQPRQIRGVLQEPKHGVSMTYTFDDANAPRQRHTQYFEMHGNRGIWHDGWKLVTNHVDSPSFEEDVWELYHTDEDFSECNDLADQYPEKVEELKALWWHEAGKYGVLPLIESHFRTRDGFNFNKILKFPPTEYKNRYVFFPEMTPHYSAPRVSGKSFVINAYLDYKEGDEGVLVGAGSNSSGYTIYISDGFPTFHYNYLQEWGTDIAGDRKLEEGTHVLTFSFMQIDKGKGVGALYIDGIRCGTPKEICSEPLFPVAGCYAIGRYGETPITPAHRGKGYYRYSGRFSKIEYLLGRPENDEDLMLEYQYELENE